MVGQSIVGKMSGVRRMISVVSQHSTSGGLRANATCSHHLPLHRHPQRCQPHSTGAAWVTGMRAGAPSGARGWGREHSLLAQTAGRLRGGMSEHCRRLRYIRPYGGGGGVYWDDDDWDDDESWVRGEKGALFYEVFEKDV